MGTVPKAIMKLADYLVDNAERPHVEREISRIKRWVRNKLVNRSNF